MLRIAVVFVCAAAALAQNADNPFDKPPAEVDQALRGRINEFYQYHVSEEYRKAEALVAEDTKDFYYSHNKPHYLSFEISRIQYSDNYTRAKATVVCEQYVMVPGFADKPLKVPIPSTWKIVDGKWYWYVDQESLKETPFGRMTPGPGLRPANAAGLPAIPTSPDAFLHQVKADRTSVRLTPGKREQVMLSNTAPGNMTVTLAGSLPGVTAKLEHGEMKIGEKAVLSLLGSENAKSGLLNLRVEQTGEVITIQVEVQ